MTFTDLIGMDFFYFSKVNSPDILHGSKLSFEKACVCVPVNAWCAAVCCSVLQCVAVCCSLRMRVCTCAVRRRAALPPRPLVAAPVPSDEFSTAAVYIYTNICWYTKCMLVHKMYVSVYIFI